MNNKKKWMVTLAGDYFDWVKETSKEAGITGSEVICEALRMVQTENERKFKENLIEAQRRLQLEKLEAEDRTIQDKIRQLKEGKRLKQPV